MNMNLIRYLIIGVSCAYTLVYCS